MYSGEFELLFDDFLVGSEAVDIGERHLVAKNHSREDTGLEGEMVGRGSADAPKECDFGDARFAVVGDEVIGMERNVDLEMTACGGEIVVVLGVEKRLEEIGEESLVVENNGVVVGREDGVEVVEVVKAQSCIDFVASEA